MYIFKGHIHYILVQHTYVSEKVKVADEDNSRSACQNLI